MTTASLKDVRKQAWETRRAKYGEHGHKGSYNYRRCHCNQMTALLVKLHNEEVLSEGQVCRATGLDRVSIRKLADAQRVMPPTTDAPQGALLPTPSRD